MISRQLAQRVSSGFDKLGVYGPVNQVWRFLLDLNHDGASDFLSVPDTIFQSVSRDDVPPLRWTPSRSRLPANSWGKAGDEIGLFDPFNVNLINFISKPRWVWIPMAIIFSLRPIPLSSWIWIRTRN